MTFEQWLQARLVAHGARITVDGDIGRMTIGAIGNFQSEHGLPRTGVADAATIAALRAPLVPGKKALDPAPAATLPPWMYELVRRLGLHEVDDKADLTEFLKIGKFLGDPSKAPWCGDGIESAIVKTLPNEAVPSNPFFAQNWKDWAIGVEAMVGAIGVIAWSKTAGHVGTVSYVTKDRIGMVGGNQSNAITNSSFPRSAFIAFRWPRTFPITKYPAFKGAAIDGGGIVSTR